MKFLMGCFFKLLKSGVCTGAQGSVSTGTTGLRRAQGVMSSAQSGVTGAQSRVSGVRTGKKRTHGRASSAHNGVITGTTRTSGAQSRVCAGSDRYTH